MRFETTPAFDADVRRLEREHVAAFRAFIAPFSDACDEFARNPACGELVCRWRRVGDHDVFRRP